MKGLASVSEIVAGMHCAVRLYLDRDLPGAESPRYTVAKQVSYHLGEVLECDQIWNEITTILPRIEPAMRVFLDSCVEACKGRDWPVPVETDVMVESGVLGIRGMVDKVYDQAPYFAITRSSDAPANGTYMSDRVRVACFAACVHETLDLPIESGYIEYIPSGELRTCMPQPRDRRAMVRGIRAAQRIRAGEVPRRPLMAPCESCPHEDACNSRKGKLLSEFL
ncbi:MAG: Dna2/Cas4 domain-containing protein [Methanomicrobiales archaeon]|nr:Dna2/Cas4 domain-containing protein [Methanomicrobiales archaeon]